MKLLYFLKLIFDFTRLFITNMTKFITILLFIISINNVIGFSIGNHSDINTSLTTSSSITSSSTTSSSTKTTTTFDNKDMSLAEILITVISVTIVSMIIVYCCCKCSEQEDNNRW